MTIRFKITLSSIQMNKDTGWPDVRKAVFTVDDLPGGMTSEKLSIHPHAPRWVKEYTGPLEMNISRLHTAPITPGLDERALRLATKIRDCGIRLIGDGFQHPAKAAQWTLPAVSERCAAEQLAGDIMDLEFGIDIYEIHDRLAGDKDADRATLRSREAADRKARLAIATSPSLAFNIEAMVVAFASTHATGSKQYIRDRVKNGTQAIIDLLSVDGRILMPGKADTAWQAILRIPDQGRRKAG